uniref:Uncharacterized protein n=1 Tax=Avena sativa TaxID=4498 RepID=A0ACD5Z8T2_AVESA
MWRLRGVMSNIIAPTPFATKITVWSVVDSLLFTSASSSVCSGRKERRGESAGDRPQPVTGGGHRPSPQSPDWTQRSQGAAELMDASEENLPLIENPSVDGESPQHSLAVVSKVLDDDDLLVEILLRIGFPTTLVHAALVCKRWLNHASDRKFLSRFHERNPPRLLGFYIDSTEDPSVAARFFPMLPQPPELDIIMRRASFSLDSYQSVRTNIMGCRNGGVLISCVDNGEITVGLHSPLCPGRGLAIVPPFPHPGFEDAYFPIWGRLLSKEEGDGMSDIYVCVCKKDMTEYVVHVYVLQNSDIAWCRLLTLAADQLASLRFEPRAVLANDKIFIASERNDIVVLDLTTKSISTLQLPQGVQYGHKDIVFAGAKDASVVYLIHAKNLQLHIWLHKGDTWLVVDTICLRGMIANLGIPGCKLEDEPTAPLWINHVGDYAEFVFLEMGPCTLLLDTKCRQLRKVYTMPKNYRYRGVIHPFMMIWPPTFPALKDDPARNTL